MLHSTDRTILKLAAFALGVFPHVALAEVSDKEPASSLFWCIGIAAALLCLVTARFKPWLGLLAFLPAALWFTSLFLEIHSPDVGPHLLREQGVVYYWQAYASLFIALCGLLLGYVWHKRRAA